MDSISRDTEEKWALPDPVLLGRMHGVVSSLCNSLMVFPHRHRLHHEGSQLEPGKEVRLYQVESFSWLWGRQARKLINESVGTFLSLQKIMQEGGGAEERKPTLVKKCREYRSMIQASMEESIIFEPEEVESDLHAYGQVLYKMELILSLLEILFIDTKPGGLVLNQLVVWVRSHFPTNHEKKSEALESDHPHQHPSYWEIIYGLVLQGSLDDVRQMLSHHPRADTDPFLSMDELLRKMPFYQVYGGVSAAEFTVRWQHWQGECERRLEEGHFATCPKLLTICKILCGDLDTIGSLWDLTDTWYHLMVSTLLYTNPTAKLFHLAGAAQDAIEHTRGNHSAITPLDRILLASMEADTHQVIKECQQVLDNPWFTTHLTDLLYHTFYQQAEFKFLGDLRETLILEYSEVLSGHGSLWQVGVLYLDHCGTSGIAMAQVVLERRPLTSDAVAHKVVQMARDRKFDNVVMSVCRVMGRRALDLDRLGSAIWWGVRSRDAAFTSHIAHKILQRYVEDGKFESSPLLDQLGPAMLLSDTLTFLGKYREFHMLYQDGKYQEAATLLVSLISSKLAPEYFWPVLLLDALPLLKCPKPVITSEQTYELMYLLNNLHTATTTNTEKQNGTATETSQEAFLEKERDIRLALTNNLAKAIIKEGTVES
ncbi:hypothetical protein Pmani_020927 [Petrolisthes manimaculis]|uniref:Nuclear pore complex protein Nup85 n=1 Tax=Petrolisthes manimaculis TaxID=1843537 RepID=A0AAE1PGM7_9EUCA|nr:hypothetical protein Pmani_020927 [Petrolisthes manimaculis]